MFIKAKYAAVCGCGCGKAINTGDTIKWIKGEKAKRIQCIKKNERHGNNPWVSKSMYGETAAAFGEHGMYFTEYEAADQMPPVKCGKCNDNAWFKPTVGAYVCRNCNSVRTDNENWV